MKNKKKILSFIVLLSLVFVLSGCGSGEITQNSTGVWDRYFVYYFAEAIKFLSFGKPALGIVLFTLIVRIILLPLMHVQNKSMRKTQELQPQLKALKEEYPGSDVDSRNKLNEETQKLYKEAGVNPYAGCLPLLIQLPIMMALYQAILRVPELTSGTIFNLSLGKPDPYFVLPILAAIFTFLSTKLSSMSQLETNASMKIMNWIMPVFIFVTAVNLPLGLSLYWVISNGFQVAQTLLINNPFKIKKEREEQIRLEKERIKALKKAQNPRKKKNKKKK